MRITPDTAIDMLSINVLGLSDRWDGRVVYQLRREEANEVRMNQNQIKI